MQDQINSRIDLVLRMADEKWRLAQHAYDRLDVNIRRLDADLGRMEVGVHGFFNGQHYMCMCVLYVCGGGGARSKHAF